MKVLEVIADSYTGKWERLRRACRGVVIEDGKILMSHERVSGLWMIPGGGLEEGDPGWAEARTLGSNYPEVPFPRAGRPTSGGWT